ncbi:hypothetical protein N9Z44_01695 [Mariniblastus sp.]|nr:hypothetical protein [Mariniblastus sp.]
MITKVLYSVCLCSIIFTLGCSGIKNSMRASEKNSLWNPIQKVSNDSKEKKSKSDIESTPVTMTAIWTDSVYEKAGEASVKGFGGRIFFYNANEKLVKADGELIIYGFDDSSKNSTDRTADKKFVYPQDKFQSHYSENKLGASYSVWVPWEPMGGYRKAITLIPMFRTADGDLIKCTQTIAILPGKVRPDTEVADSEGDQPYKVLGSSSAVIRRAGYHSGMAIAGDAKDVSQVGFQGKTAESNKIKTSTISMTPSMSRRLALANQNRAAELRGADGFVSPEASHRDSVGSETDGIVTTALPGLPSREIEPVKESTEMPRKARAFGMPGAF